MPRMAWEWLCMAAWREGFVTLSIICLVTPAKDVNKHLKGQRIIWAPSVKGCSLSWCRRLARGLLFTVAGACSMAPAVCSWHSSSPHIFIGKKADRKWDQVVKPQGPPLVTFFH